MILPSFANQQGINIINDFPGFGGLTTHNANSLLQIQYCPRVVSLKHCTLAHPSRGIHRGAESAPAAATAASSCASTGNAIAIFFRVNHGFLTMRGMWRDCGIRFSEAETQSHARTVSRESPHLCLWSHVQRVPAVSVWQHCRPADTGDSLLTMPHRSKKDKVKLFSWVSCLSESCRTLSVLCLLSFSITRFRQESSKLGRSKKSGGKNGPADDQDVSTTF